METSLVVMYSMNERKETNVDFLQPICITVVSIRFMILVLLNMLAIKGLFITYVPQTNKGFLYNENFCTI